MNTVTLMGRLTKDPDTRYTAGEKAMAVSRFALAVDRRTKEKETDFISCVAFGKIAETIEKYVIKGMKILLQGRIQTGSYTNREGKKVYTTDVVVTDFEFCEKKGESVPEKTPSDEFVDIPDDLKGPPFK